MAEYDAFGRKIGDDPLEGLGWDSSGRPGEASASRQAEQAATPVASAPITRTPAGRPPRRRRSRGRLVAFGVVFVFASAILLSIGGAILAVVDEVNDQVVSTPSLSPREPGGRPGEATDERPAPVDRPPRGLRRGSLILPENLRPALRRLRRETNGRIRMLRLAPDRLDAQLVTPRGYLFSAQVGHRGGVEVGSKNGPGFDTSSIPYSRISTTAPRKLVRAAAASIKRPTDGIDYLVIMDIGATPAWNAHFKNGASFRGDPAGRIVQRIN